MKNPNISIGKITKIFHFYYGRDENWMGLNGVYFFVIQLVLFYWMLEIIYLGHE